MAKKRNNVLWQMVVIVLLILSFYYWRPLTQVADRMAAHVAGSVLYYYKTCADYVRSIDSWTQTKQKLAQSVQQLNQERSSLVAQLTELRAQQRYTEDIRELVDFRQRYAHMYDAHIVHIVLKHFSNDSHYFLVEGGTNNGFVPNMIAVIDNHLIGRVVELYPAYSKVQLITDKTLKVAACCARTKAYGIFTGMCNIKEAALNFVDLLQEVVEGDMVLSSGTGLVYPQGLCLGTIIRFVKKDVDYEIVLQPLVDFERLEYCFLLPPLLVGQQSTVPSCPEICAHSDG